MKDGAMGAVSQRKLRKEGSMGRRAAGREGERGEREGEKE